jgi:hypothetical protein
MSTAPTLSERQPPPLQGPRLPQPAGLDPVAQQPGPYREWCFLIGLASGAGETGEHLVVRSPPPKHLLRTIPLTSPESITRDEP